MSKRASPTIIGAFVVGAVALLVVGLVAFGSMNLFRRPLTYVMFFDSSVSGLSVGAASSSGASSSARCPASSRAGAPSGSPCTSGSTWGRSGACGGTT